MVPQKLISRKATTHHHHHRLYLQT